EGLGVRGEERELGPRELFLQTLVALVRQDLDALADPVLARDGAHVLGVAGAENAELEGMPRARDAAEREQRVEDALLAHESPEEEHALDLLRPRALDPVEEVAHAEIRDVDASGITAENLDQLAARELGVREQDLGLPVGLDHEAAVGGAHHQTPQPRARALARERHLVGEPGRDVPEAHSALSQDRRQVGGLVEEAEHAVDRALLEQALDRAADGPAIEGPVERVRVDARDPDAEEAELLLDLGSIELGRQPRAREAAVTARRDAQHGDL